MAAAMARGWVGAVDSMLFTDSGSGRATQLATEVGGERASSNQELVEKSDIVVLAVKPAALDQVAPELEGAEAVISLLGATGLERLRGALPGAVVTRVMPNLGVEVRRGVMCVSGETGGATRAVLEQLGRVVELPDERIDAATAVMGCSPAYFALIVEALTKAGSDSGLDPAQAQELVVETMAGTAELLRDHEPTALRAAVASPGGSTEAGLEALEREGARGAFAAAVEASLKRMRG